MSILSPKNLQTPGAGIALFGKLRSLEALLQKESGRFALFAPFVEKIHTLLINGQFQEALSVVNEMEEFIDLEFNEVKSCIKN